MRIQIRFQDQATADVIDSAALWDGERLILEPVTRHAAERSACSVCGDVQPGGGCPASRTCRGCRIRKRRLVAKLSTSDRPD